MDNNRAPHPAIRPLPSDLADHLDLVLTSTGHDADDVIDALTTAQSADADDDAMLAEIRDGYTVHTALDTALDTDAGEAASAQGAASTGERSKA